MSNIYHSSYGNRALLENSDSDVLFFTNLGTSNDDNSKATLFGAIYRKELDSNDCAIAFLSEEDKKANNLNVDSGFYYMFKIEKDCSIKVLYKVGKVGSDGPKGADAAAIIPPQGDKGEVGDVTLYYTGTRESEETPATLNKNYRGIVADDKWKNNVTPQSNFGIYCEKITRYGQTTTTNYVPPCYTFEHSFDENNYVGVTKGLIILNPYAGIFQNVRKTPMSYIGAAGGLAYYFLNDGVDQYYKQFTNLRKDGSNRIALAYTHEVRYNSSTDILTNVKESLKLIQILEDDSIYELDSLGGYEWNYYSNVDKGYGRMVWSNSMSKTSGNSYMPIFSTFSLTPVYATGTSTIIDYEETLSTQGLITLNGTSGANGGMARAFYSLMNPLEAELKNPLSYL